MPTHNPFIFTSFHMLLRTTRTSPVLLRTTKYYKVLLQRLQYYSVLLQYYSVLLQPYYKALYWNDGPTSIQYYSSTTKYYKYYSSTKYTPVLPRTTKEHWNDVRTTSYYKVLQVLLQYYSVLQSTTPVLQKLPKRAFRARLPQLFKQQASKTSVSCEASATFHVFKLPKRAFRARRLQLSINKSPKRAFRARLPQLFKQQASKTSISCEASATFQRRSFKVLRLPRKTRK